MHIFPIKFDGNIRFGTRHQLIETQLYRLAEVKFRFRFQRFQCFFHLLHHFGTTCSTRPLIERFHDNQYICIFYRHRIRRNFRRTDFSHHMFNFRKFFHQDILRLRGDFDTIAQ